jgi:hypothetical protein
MQNVVGDSQGTGKAQNIISPPGGSGGGGGGGSFSTVTTTGLATLASLLVQNNLIGFGSFGVQLGLSRTVISAADLLSGATIPLVPAPGAGFIALPIIVIGVLDFNGTALVATSAQQVIGYFPNDIIDFSPGAMESPQNEIIATPPGPGTFPTVNGENMPVSTFSNGGTAFPAFSAGNSTLTIYMLYIVVPAT